MTHPDSSCLVADIEKALESKLSIKVVDTSFTRNISNTSPRLGSTYMHLNWKLTSILLLVSWVFIKVGLEMDNLFISGVAMVCTLLFGATLLYQTIDRTNKGLCIAMTIGFISFTLFILSAFAIDYIDSSIILVLISISLIAFGVAFILWQYEYFRPYFNLKKSERKRKQ